LLTWQFLFDELMGRCVGVAGADFRAARMGAAMIALPKKSREDQMTSIVRRLALSAALALAAAGLVQGAAAQSAADYPTRAVKVIVPFAAAGPTDVVARVIAQKLSESLGKQFYVENIAHAGGNTGMAAAAKAPGDGYTILVHGSNFIVNPSLYASIPFDPYRDFTPVTLAGTMPNVIVAHPSVPAKSVKELIALVKANPGKYSYGQPGTGSTPHLAGELFKLKFGLDLTMVPFGSAAPAITSTIGGHTPIAFTALPPAMANIQDGKLRGLAVLAAKRNAGVPDVPTMAESGVPDQESDTVTGIVALANTPKDIVDRWHREIVRIVALPDVNQRLRTLGFDPVGNSPAEYAERIRTEGAKWDRVAKEAKIVLE
jgi:tripartite-type tricarboxylate transporter receptor subunit TctC